MYDIIAHHIFRNPFLFNLRWRFLTLNWIVRLTHCCRFVVCSFLLCIQIALSVSSKFKSSNHSFRKVTLSFIFSRPNFQALSLKFQIINEFLQVGNQSIYLRDRSYELGVIGSTGAVLKWLIMRLPVILVYYGLLGSIYCTGRFLLTNRLKKNLKNISVI